jgi:PAS domain S-box-containing protein
VPWRYVVILQTSQRNFLTTPSKYAAQLYIDFCEESCYALSTDMKKNSRTSTGFFIRPIELLIIITASIFGSGALVDLILSLFPSLSVQTFALVDAVLLTVILFPLIYYLAYEPLKSYIEELKRTEETLQGSEAKYRSLVETTDDSIYLVNRKCEYLFMNAKHQSRLSILFDKEYVGRAYSDFHSPEETNVFSEKVNEVFETGEPLQHEHRSQRDGHYFLRTLSPVEGPNGELVAVSIVSKDITKLKKESEAELRYRAIFEQSPYGILIIDTTGNIIEFNETARRELGYSREEFTKLRISDIDAIRSPEEIQARINEVLYKGSAEFEVMHKTKDGKIRDVHVITRVVDSLGHKVLQSIWHDITERKRAEEALNNYRNQLEKKVKERQSE